MKLISAAFATVLLSSVAQAGLYIEPYLGYDSATSKGDITITSPAQVLDVDTEDTGARFGSRLGFATENWIFGADFLTGELTDDNDDKSTHTDVGAFIAYKLNKKYVLNLGYIATSTIKADDLEITGSGFRFGVGFVVHERININVDYLMTTYDDFDFQNLEGKADIEKGSAVLSVSFPFEF